MTNIEGAQPGGRSTRQENEETELILPGLQAGLRALIDIIAVLLILMALLLMGRWVIWALVALFFFSDTWDKLQDNVIGKFYGVGADGLELGAIIVKWGWIIFGYLFLRLLVPVEWTLDSLIFRRAVLEPAWPFVWRVAAIPIPFRPFTRLIFLIICLTPLISWVLLRDRLKWSLWEFTPFGPVDIAEQGIDPHRWGPQQFTVTPAHDFERGVIFEKTDYEPHVQRVAEGVFLSNGSGRSTVRVDMRWVTEDQWRSVARILIVDGMPFAEEILGRGRVFPTHGPYSEIYSANLGFRFFRAQMIEAGRAERRGIHENSGIVLTSAGEDFLQRQFLNGDFNVMEKDDDER